MNHKVHHIWLQGGIPEKYQENYDKWSQYDNKVWSEKELLDLCSDKQVEQYMTIETLINRVNFLKYILLYSEGGIYADLDSYPVQSLYKFFEETEIKGIDKDSLLSIRYPYNTTISSNKFGDYEIILPGRKTMMFYPNGDKPILLDNPILMSLKPKNEFWINLIDWCSKRTNLKAGGLSDTEFLPHEPYGPYGMTDYLFSNYKFPYSQKILVLPTQYLLGCEEPDENMYILHTADGGW